MPSTKTRVPAVDGWFRAEDPPALLGSRCTSCGNFAFPREAMFCRNPACDSTTFDEVPLSTRGRVWSYTDARYTPPAPYVAAEPYEPFCIAAVELDTEKMVVLGQVAAGVTVDDLAVGTEVELVVDTLYEDDDREYLVWKWRPVGWPGAGAGAGASGGDDA